MNDVNEHKRGMAGLAKLRLATDWCALDCDFEGIVAAAQGEGGGFDADFVSAVGGKRVLKIYKCPKCRDFLIY